MNASDLELYLRAGFLREAERSVAQGGPDLRSHGQELFALLRTTRAAPLARRVGALLAVAVTRGLHAEVVGWSLAALNDGMPAWRLQSLTGDSTIRRALLAELGEREPRRRVAALKALSPQVQDPEVFPAVVAQVADSAEHVASTAIEVLRPVGAHPAVRDLLLGSFSYETHPTGVVRAVRRTLGAVADDPYVERALVELIKRGHRLAAECLQHVRGSEHLRDELLNILSDSTTRELQHLWQALIPVASDERIVKVLLPYLRGPDSSTVQQVLRVLGRADTEEARAAVIAMLAHEKNYVRWGALEQLGRHMHRSDARAAVLSSLEDEDDSVRMYALRALGRIDDVESRAIIRAKLDDSSNVVALTAVQLITAREPDPAAWPVLSARLSEFSRVFYSRSWQPISVLACVGRLAELPHVRDAVARDLDAYSEKTRLDALRALRISTPTADLVARVGRFVLEDERPHVASAAYETLAEWGKHLGPHMR